MMRAAIIAVTGVIRIPTPTAMQTRVRMGEQRTEGLHLLDSEALVAGRPADVRLVMVDGTVLYGDAALSSTTASTDCEAIDVCGMDRFICVAEPTTD